MRKIELDRLLEKTVADALGLSLPPVANSHRALRGKPHRAYARKHPVTQQPPRHHERVVAHG